MVSYLAFVLSLLVLAPPSFGAVPVGGLCLVIVAHPGYLLLYFTVMLVGVEDYKRSEDIFVILN